MQYEPLTLEAIQRLRNWEIQAIEAANGFNRRPGVWRLTKKLGGGKPPATAAAKIMKSARIEL